jgi:hypothetical protein
MTNVDGVNGPVFAFVVTASVSLTITFVVSKEVLGEYCICDILSAFFIVAAVAVVAELSYDAYGDSSNTKYSPAIAISGVGGGDAVGLVLVFGVAGHGCGCGCGCDCRT